MARNPDVISTSKEFFIRIRESSLYLSVMGNASTGVAPKEYVWLPHSFIGLSFELVQSSSDV